MLSLCNAQCIYNVNYDTTFNDFYDIVKIDVRDWVESKNTIEGSLSSFDELFVCKDYIGIGIYNVYFEENGSKYIDSICVRDDNTKEIITLHSNNIKNTDAKFNTLISIFKREHNITVVSYYYNCVSTYKYNLTDFNKEYNYLK
jgi:hypothetical protein